MLHALAIAALTVVPAQVGQIKLTDIRLTVGDLGPTRKDAKFLPGDALHLRFDIDGLNITDEGVAKYMMETRVTDKNGKQIFKRDPEERTQIALLRGGTLPAAALLLIGLDMEPGNYTLDVTVEDPKTKAKDSTSLKFEVLKRDFGIVALHTTADFPGYIPTSTTGTVGQTMVIWYTVASFERDTKTTDAKARNQPNLELQVQVIDEKGNPTQSKPIKQEVKEVDEKFGAISPQYPLFLSRPGKFTVQITAIDKVANKKAVYEWPITVLSTK